MDDFRGTAVRIVRVDSKDEVEAIIRVLGLMMGVDER